MNNIPKLRMKSTTKQVVKYRPISGEELQDRIRGANEGM